MAGCTQACSPLALAGGIVVQSLDLEPDDRLVMVTDGMLERNAGGLDLSDLIVRTRGLHPHEAARTLIAAMVDANHVHLQDDATVMCLDWHGVAHSERDADTGADLTDASTPARTRWRTTPSPRPTGVSASRCGRPTTRRPAG
ncbi:SpoIIE family protein phosphatase [Streptomyces sp. NPDC048448]|uniref:SpoIIE family protein phosphatase n=1 Tax=Streptomyces sp. NPDC048448 TaxID=3365554 RepID=UPI0037180E91